MDTAFILSSQENTSINVGLIYPYPTVGTINVTGTLSGMSINNITLDGSVTLTGVTLNGPITLKDVTETKTATVQVDSVTGNLQLTPATAGASVEIPMLRFITGVWPEAVGGQSCITGYEYISGSYYWTGPWTAPGLACTVKYTRLGNLINIYSPMVLGTTKAGNTWSIAILSSWIPWRFCPFPCSIYQPCTVVMSGNHYEGTLYIPQQEDDTGGSWCAGRTYIYPTADGSTLVWPSSVQCGIRFEVTYVHAPTTSYIKFF
jgi:hypothetical protein